MALDGRSMAGRSASQKIGVLPKPVLARAVGAAVC